MHFDRAVSPKQWGDPPFTVSASITAGATVSYSAAGACRMQGRQTVAVVAVGTCLIKATAAAPDRAPATASLSVPVSRAQPVIHFGDRAVPFFRPFSLPLGATSTPAIPLTYRVVHGAVGSYYDQLCNVLRGALTLSNLATSPWPFLPTACVIEVSAAQSSPNYADPAPLRALIKIGFPVLRLRVPAVGTVHWNSLGPTHELVVKIYEDSGDAYGVYVGGPAPCSQVEVTPGFPTPVGVTEYFATVTLAADPATYGQYTCAMGAQTPPSDHIGAGTTRASFTLTIEP